MRDELIPDWILEWGIRLGIVGAALCFVMAILTSK